MYIRVSIYVEISTCSVNLTDVGIYYTPVITINRLNILY